MPVCKKKDCKVTVVSLISITIFCDDLLSVSAILLDESLSSTDVLNVCNTFSCGYDKFWCTVGNWIFNIQIYQRTTNLYIHHRTRVISTIQLVLYSIDGFP